MLVNLRKTSINSRNANLQWVYHFVDFILHFFLLKGILNSVQTVEQTSQPVGNAHLIIHPYYVAICYLYMANMYAYIHLILICFFRHSFWNHTMQTNWFKVGISTPLESSSQHTTFFTFILIPSGHFIHPFTYMQPLFDSMVPWYLIIYYKQQSWNESLQLIILCFYTTWCHTLLRFCVTL